MADYLKQSIKYRKYVKLGYHHILTYGIYLFLVALAAGAAAHLSRRNPHGLREHLIRCNMPGSVIFSSALLIPFLAALYICTRPRPVYLLDFSCAKPADAHKCSRQRFLEVSQQAGFFSEESLEFQRRIGERSGLGDSTYLPTSLLTVPAELTMAGSRKEADVVVYGALDELFAKTSVRPKDIDVLITNCSTFNPTPSLSAMIVDCYKLREDVVSYNLGGMGCSAGIIAVDLARGVLQVRPNTYALVVSTENITVNWYRGNDCRSMLVSNCLFRMGAAAVLLSNRWSDRRRSKYQLVRTVRTHRGADDTAFACAAQVEDDKGMAGIYLSTDLRDVAGEALRSNITTLAPHVLPLSEQLFFLLATLVGKTKVLIKMKTRMKPYVPDFNKAFEHFCVHAGGRAVLDELQKKLKLSEWHMEPSRMTLHRFGNTSSSSLLYELAYAEGKGRVKKGDRIWQIALGSGFKCNSAVWKALRTVNPAKEKNPWMDEINQFPVEIPNVSAL